MVCKNMVNFVIYEDNNYYITLYEQIIHKFMAFNNDQYKIYKYNEYNDKIIDDIRKMIGQTIYILGIEVNGKSGLELAKEIRNISNSTNDQIIIATTHTDLIMNTYHKKLLILDFLSKLDDLEENLLECFKYAYILFNKNKTLSFKLDGEIFRIPYDDILYIEKDKNNSCLYVHTQNDKFKCKNSIVDLEQELSGDMRFYRSHRSSIINISKIVKIDMTNSIIYFNKKKTSYLARDRKKELESRIKIIG